MLAFQAFRIPIEGLSVRKYPPDLFYIHFIDSFARSALLKLIATTSYFISYLKSFYWTQSPAGFAKHRFGSNKLQF